MKSLDFNDLELIELPVQVKGVSYVLREASEASAVKYRNTMLACTRFGSEGNLQSMSGMASVEPLLVSLCLFTTEGKAVSLATVQSWPSRIVKALFEEAKRISELEEEEETQEALEERLKVTQEKLVKLQKDELGNVPENTEDGSA